MQESVWIESRGYKMLGILEYDKVENKGKKIIVLIHGFTGTKSEIHRLYRKLSYRLSNQGYTVLRFDFVGSGDSDGDFRDMTINREIEDGLNVLRYCKENFAAEKLYIVGFSLGGCIASILASKSQCDGLVLWSSVSNPFWNFYHIFGKKQFNRGLKGEDIDYSGDIVGTDFFKELIDVNPLEYSKDYNNPVLIIHGTGDEDVLPLNSLCYNRVFSNSSIYFIENADHCYSSKEFETELLNTTVKYFTDFLES